MQLRVIQPTRRATSNETAGGVAPIRGAQGGGPDRARANGSVTSVRVLRISITDRCNLRCVYCMPAAGVRWLPPSHLLTCDEIAQVARAALDVHGIDRFKVTGGEPTLRRDLPRIIAALQRIGRVRDLSLTTNGLLLERLAQPLREAGLSRVTVSIDSLRDDRFRRITRGGELRDVMRGLDACERAGLTGTKVNVVTMRGVNDDELVDFARLTLTRPVTLRFIEYMPLGDAAVMHWPEPGGDGAECGPAAGCGAQHRGAGVFIAEREVRQRIEHVLGPLHPIDRALEPGVGPSVVYRLGHSAPRGRIGFISAMSQPFCSTCNRLRLTADGILRSCLFDGGDVAIRSILREAAMDQAALTRMLGIAMEGCVRLRPLLHSEHGNEQMSRLGG